MERLVVSAEKPKSLADIYPSEVQLASVNVKIKMLKKE